MEYLFVYGTLLKDFKHKVLESIKDELTLIGPATVKGELYDLGNYPGYIAGKGEVKGELYSIKDTHKVFGVLDEYEGLHDAEPEYIRKTVAVMLPGGETVESWIYVYQQPHHQYKKITDGDYIAWVRNKVNNEGNY